MASFLLLDHHGDLRSVPSIGRGPSDVRLFTICDFRPDTKFQFLFLVVEVTFDIVSELSLEKKSREGAGCRCRCAHALTNFLRDEKEAAELSTDDLLYQRHVLRVCIRAIMFLGQSASAARNKQQSAFSETKPAEETNFETRRNCPRKRRLMEHRFVR